MYMFHIFMFTFPEMSSVLFIPLLYFITELSSGQMRTQTDGLFTGNVKSLRFISQIVGALQWSHELILLLQQLTAGEIKNRRSHIFTRYILQL